MIRILKEGNKETKLQKKENKEYIKKCHNCKCVFTYQKRDMHIHYDDWKWVECPCCKCCCNVIFPKMHKKIAKIDLKRIGKIEIEGR